MDNDMPWENYNQSLTQPQIGGSWNIDQDRFMQEILNDNLSPEELQEVKALAQSKSHSEAERRRRERINNHLNSLRKMIPSDKKADKATLLAEVIHRVNELDGKVSEKGKNGLMPNDYDEVSVVQHNPAEQDQEEDGCTFFKATLSCEDRPDVLPGLLKAVQSLGLEICEAEMASLGVRVKHELVLSIQDNSGDSQEEIEKRPTLAVILEALKRVLDPKRASHMEDLPSSPDGKRRQKSSGSSHSD